MDVEAVTFNKIFFWEFLSLPLRGGLTRVLRLPLHTLNQLKHRNKAAFISNSRFEEITLIKSATKAQKHQIRTKLSWDFVA